ncbi:MAG: SUMF1/EgtB/PvdO family nonheme iron enzyme [Bacteroidales bacterium]|nr:SUMF1/EgtB/PvdO family nonheme iron enzyme [Bacteroidales bacterium]
MHNRKIITGSNRVNRGGSWNNNANNCRVANRNNNNPNNYNNNIGFRLVRRPQLTNKAG